VGIYPPSASTRRARRVRAIGERQVAEMKEGLKSMDDNEIRRSLSDEAAPEPRTEAGSKAPKRSKGPKRGKAGLDPHARNLSHLATPVAHLATEKIIKALKATGGSVAEAARRLGVSRQSLYSRMRVEPRIREARDEIREMAIDDVEEVLIAKALAGEPWAVMMWLRYHAKHRGYTDRVVVEQKVEPSDWRARVEASKIDLRALTAEQLECLAEIGGASSAAGARRRGSLPARPAIGRPEDRPPCRALPRPVLCYL
jgi:transposase-like protein